MKHNRAASTFGKLFLAFSILFGIGILTSTTAQAQWQNDPYYRQTDRDREYRREQRRRQREYRREQRRENRDNNGYGYGYGNNGYRDADGYGNYGGSFNLRQTALNAGFADGVKEGRKDRDRNERYDYSDEDKYREGTRDYSSRLGDRYIYQRYYREAFSHGYADGYAGYN
ncbi:MAG TPA: hypothetical protein VN256_03000 [Pyrinomonadaceae bacterium]|nr:hypothetical protein [Pyrinomonadaceae bacterium]